MRISTAEFIQIQARMNASKRTKLDLAPLGEPVKKESELHDEIIQYCKSRGWFNVHSRMDRASTQAKGIPDFLIAMPHGVTWWIECKSKGGKPTKEQQDVHAFLHHLGHRYALVYSFQEFLTAVNS